MPKTQTPAAGEAMSAAKMNRRALMTGSAATAAALAATTIPAEPASIAGHESPAFFIQPGSPAVTAARDAFYAAREELEAAQAALERLVDEYRHLWPPAPEELLGAANAEHLSNAERDLAGRLIMRDTAPLTKRLPKEFRRDNEKTCFAVETAQDIKEKLERWRKHKPTGRTKKSLARNIAWRKNTIKMYEEKYPLALEYEAETARLREVSGVDALKERIVAAEERVALAAYDVAMAPAVTVADFRIKAEIVREHSGGLWDELASLPPTSKLALPVAALITAIESVEERG